MGDPVLLELELPVTIKLANRSGEVTKFTLPPYGFYFRHRFRGAEGRVYMKGTHGDVGDNNYETIDANTTLVRKRFDPSGDDQPGETVFYLASPTIDIEVEITALRFGK